MKRKEAQNILGCVYNRRGGDQGGEHWECVCVRVFMSSFTPETQPVAASFVNLSFYIVIRYRVNHTIRIHLHLHSRKINIHFFREKKCFTQPGFLVYNVDKSQSLAILLEHFD